MRSLLWTLSRIMRSSMTRTMSTLRTWSGRNACGEVHQQPQAVCQNMQDLEVELTMENHPVQVWPGSQGNDREAELDSR